jgi:hypothetical protein
MKLIDLVGKRFGRLTVISKGERDRYSKMHWLCKCDCGNETMVCVSNLKSGHTTSCGCFRNETSSSNINHARKFRTPPKEDANLNTVYGIYKRTSKLRDLCFELTKNEFENLIIQNCHYCDRKPSNIMNRGNNKNNFIYNGIDRVDNTKGYTLDNCVPCCYKCNKAKGTMPTNEFLDWVVEVYHHSAEGR